MKRIFAMIVLSVSLLFLGSCSEDEARSFTIDQVTIDTQIDKKGIMHVRELYTYTFNGSFQGMTRSIDSDVQQFKAYLMNNNSGEPTMSTEKLEPLTIEKEEDTWKIYSESTDETKQVLYSYEVQGSVKKYADIADVTYAFFDEANETDLHDVEISIHTPDDIVSKNTHDFLHGDKTGVLTTTDDHIVYTNNLLEAGQNTMIRFIFPAEELSEMKITKDKKMEDIILFAEHERMEREAQLGEKTNQLIPILWIFVFAIIIVTVFILFIHPNRYRGNKGIDGLIQLLEKTDPLFISYINRNASLSDQSVIAALFSLKQRGIIKLREVSSAINEEKTTFRFTWIHEHTAMDFADDYLRKWLFTEKDKEGQYFLLESIVDNPDENESVREKKAEKFGEKLSTWKKLIREKEEYQKLRRPFRGFSLFSIPLTMITYGLFYYFTQIDPISQTEQWVLPLILGILGVFSLIFSRTKWVLVIYYIFLITASLIGFTLTGGSILAVVSYVIACVALLIVPAYVWEKEIRQLKYAMNQAYHMMKAKRYPLGSDPNKIERRLEYAIVLDAGREYAEQCGKEKAVKQLDYPLLNNPIHATESFNSGSLVLLSSVIIGSDSSTTNTTTSSTGGGGAGAF